jgi:GNAT superfamily N-acetyltransferase
LTRALVDLQDFEMGLHDSRLPGAGVAAAYLAELLDRIDAQEGAIFVAEEDSAFVGFVACLVADEATIGETPDSCRYGYVTDIFVTSSRRGTGLAQRLLSEAERHLATTGVRRLRINALARNDAAHRAYERYGFAPYEVMLEKPIG